MTSFPTIVKADGSNETFDPSRLSTSLMRAGASEYVAERITKIISSTVAPGASSKEIYARAFALLRKEGRPIAARYSLRRALIELGPTGHPFEDFISRLYRAEGWQVETRKMLQGKCVAHEVDVYAQHPEQGVRLAAELKYHNDPGYKTDLKVALYVKSRFEDIFSCDTGNNTCQIDRGILVTNTKFTSEAIAYGKCAGVEMLGWGYPSDDSLFMRMSRANVYPITTLTGLSRAEKRILIEQQVITVDDIVRDRHSLDALRLAPERVGKLVAEADGLLALSESVRDDVFS